MFTFVHPVSAILSHGSPRQIHWKGFTFIQILDLHTQPFIMLTVW